ncbi:MAG: hypothetical protein PHE27_01325 [Alphaproteobacteria bacterium]|nr:hypothetical protein [Alphaproteobacteria bacterium]
MNNSTIAASEMWDASTKRIAISNDSSITASEWKNVLAPKFKKCKELKTLDLSRCSLTNPALDDVVSEIKDHKALMELNLSGNNFSDPEFLAELLTGSNNIYRIDLSGNTPEFRPKTSAGDKFIEAVFANDKLVTLKLPNDYFFDKANAHKFAALQNIISLSFNKEPTNAVMELLVAVGNLNKEEALKLKSVILTGDRLTSTEVNDISKRLPAILYLADQIRERETVIERLRAYPESGIAKHTDDVYDSSKNSPEIEQLERIKTIEEALALLPELSREEIRQKMEDGRDSVMDLATLGNETLAVINHISNVSLTTISEASSVNLSIRRMAEFREKFGAAKEIISNYASKVEPSSSTALVPQQKSMGWSFSLRDIFYAVKLGGLWDKFAGQAQDMNDLADAGEYSRAAAGILREMTPSLIKMEGDLTNQLASTQELIKAYKRVSEQICTIREVGAETLDAWRAEELDAWNEEEKGKVTILSPGFEMEQPLEELHIQVLQSRMDLLEKINLQLKNNVLGLLFTGKTCLDQQTAVTTLRSQNFPMIAQEIANFVNQVTLLENADVIRAIADTAHSVSDEQVPTAILTAAKTAQAIEKLTKATEATIDNMNAAVKEMTAVLGDPVGPDLSLLIDQNKERPMQPRKTGPSSFRFD